MVMRQFATILMLGTVLLAGCGQTISTPPPTYSVTGRVLGRDGQPLSGGVVQFVSKEQPTLNMSASISAEGNFKLQTLHENQNVAGAIQGPCEVLITLLFQAGEIPEVIVLSETFNIDTKANHFEIKLPPNAKGRT
jgi:hypothetical protein